jgi:predicted DNA-binding transcriptional regulator AlpA
MLSPAMQHRVKAEAGKQVKEAATHASGSLYRTYRIKLSADLRRLKEIRSRIQRTEVKRELLTEYKTYLDSVLAADDDTSRAQDDVLVTCLIWAADAGEVQRATELAAYALRHHMRAPASYTRPLYEVVAEEISRAALQQEPAKHLDALAQLWTLTANRDMPDEIMARLCKAYGIALAVTGTDKEQARVILQKALTLKPTIGVRSYLEKLDKGKPVAFTPTTEKIYGLSTRKAAFLVGVSSPTFMKMVVSYPKELPFVSIQLGNRNVFRFCQEDIDQFVHKRTHNAAPRQGAKK